MKKLLLGSGGLRTEGRKNLWISEADKILSGIDEVLFIPYALKDYDACTQAYVDYDLHSGRRTIGIHTVGDPIEAIRNAKAISVSGGNSFRLVNSMHENSLIEHVRDAVNSGVPYMGISAGSNMACPTIMTTNDMPIVMPPSFEALNLIPFQINPHFFAGSFYLENEGQYIQHGGETRETRLKEFHEMNDSPVLGLWEGSILKLIGNEAVVLGESGARLFSKDKDTVDYADGADLSDLI